MSDVGLLGETTLTELSGAARVLSGAQKAAAILLAMGSPPATRVLKHLDPGELRALTRAAAQLGSVSMGTIESLVAEFATDFSTGAHLLGDVGHARAMLSDALPPDQVADIVSDALGMRAEVDVWELLANIPEARFALYLQNEHPLTMTFVLSKLESSLTAKIIPLLPTELRDDIFCRFISPPVVAPLAARIVEQTLRDELLNAPARAQTSDQHARVAQIINSLEPADAAKVMLKLSETSPKDAKLLQSMLFSFDDLPTLSPRARALLFDKLSTDIVVLALRGMDADFRSTVLSPMASRARRLVEGELNNGQQVPSRDIAKARKQVVDLVLGMAQRKEISLAPSEDEDA